MSVQPGQSQGSKIVLAKLPREEYTRFQQFAERNGETINATVRRLILTEIDRPRLKRIAGRSLFDYDRRTDKFTWKIECDDGSSVVIDESVSADTLEQLNASVITAVEARNSFIRKDKTGSVSYPTRLGALRKK